MNELQYAILFNRFIEKNQLVHKSGIAIMSQSRWWFLQFKLTRNDTLLWNVMLWKGFHNKILKKKKKKKKKILEKFTLSKNALLLSTTARTSALLAILTLALMMVGRGSRIPCIFLNAGITKRLQVTTADTGLPETERRDECWGEDYGLRFEVGVEVWGRKLSELWIICSR